MSSLLLSTSVLTAALAGVAVLTLGPAASPGEDPPAAAPEDVASIDAILDAVYACISGPAGQPRQWDRFRSLMHSEAARLMAVQPGPDGKERVLTMTVESYIELVDGPFVSDGFFERELHRRVERFGHVAHVWSTFALRNTEDGEDLRRGVNSYQLLHDGERWWVASVLWDNEREDQPIPAEFLPE